MLIHHTKHACQTFRYPIPPPLSLHPHHLVVPSITTPISTPVPTSIPAIIDAILLVIARVRLLLGIMLHLLPIVEVLAVRLDQLVGLASRKAGHDVLGDGVVLCNA